MVVKMSVKTLVLVLLFLGSGALLFLNAWSAEGFFPSGHGTGKFGEVVTGACFSFAGLMLFLARRKKDSGEVDAASR